MRILVTGSNGQLARKLAERSGPQFTVTALGRPGLDISVPETVSAAIGRFMPDMVVNAAAYTAVDKAESDSAAAYAINRDGAANVARAAAHAGLPVIHVSTDYVFSGDKASAYGEDDETGPASVYGASKLEGERVVANANPRHLIVRTAWVYSEYGQNFVKTMLRLAGERDEIGVVADQFGNPTSAGELADGILLAAATILSEPDFSDYGIYHLSGKGRTSWAGFAREIFSISARLGGPTAKVRDIATSQYPTAAKRPLNSCLDNARIAHRFGWRPDGWQRSAELTVRKLVGTGI